MNLNPNSKVGNGEFWLQKWAMVIFLFPGFFQGFSRFFRVFQCFSRFFNVFQDVSGFLTLNSDEGPPPAQGGVAFFNFKGKIVFGDLKLRPPLDRESLPPKTPQMRGGTPGSARVPIKNAIFLVLKSTLLGGLSFSGFFDQTEPSPVSEFHAFQGFSRFFRIFQCFLRFFNVFQGVAGFFPAVLMKDRPVPSFGSRGVAFFNFKGKIVFGDPPLPQTPTPLETETLPPKTPQMRGTPGLARVPIKNAIFSTEIDGSGWALVFWVFGQNRAFTDRGF